MLVQKSMLARILYVRRSVIWASYCEQDALGTSTEVILHLKRADLRKQDVPCNNGNHVLVLETLRQN